MEQCLHYEYFVSAITPEKWRTVTFLVDCSVMVQLVAWGRICNWCTLVASR